MKIIFFGSTNDSVLVADALHATYPLTAVVTQPEKPVGRNQVITKTPLETWATAHTIPCLSFVQDEDHGWKYKNENDVVNAISSLKPDLFITACYGQKLPSSLLALPPLGALNIHPSLLPRWRGADPVPWTIIAGDAQTGVTISTITETFDSGDIVAQKKIPVTDKDVPDTLRTTLFTLGVQLLLDTLPQYIKGDTQKTPQKKEDIVVVRKLTRDDGYVPLDLLAKALEGQDIERKNRSGLVQEITEPLPKAIARLSRALSPWPGIWTTIPHEGKDMRVKLYGASVKNDALEFSKAQREGKTPVDWKTFQEAYLS